METVIVIMQKNKKTGFLEKEISTLKIDKYEDLILNIFSILNDDNNLKLYLKLTTPKDVSDWEYNAIYDYYDCENFLTLVDNVCEVDEKYNPTWQFELDYIDDKNIMQEKILKILEMHNLELENVFSIIKDKKGEYEKNEKESNNF